jgi:hypothetical protein
MKTRHIFFSLLFLGLVGLGMVACQKEQVISSAAEQEDASLLPTITGMTQDYLSTVEISTAKNGRWKDIIAADLVGALSNFLVFYGTLTGNELQLEITTGASTLGAAAASIAASVRANGNSQGGNNIHLPIENPGNAFDNHGRVHYVIVDEILVNHNIFIDGNDHIRFVPYLDHGYGLLEEEGLLQEGNRNHVPASVLEANHPNNLGHQNIIAYVNGINDPNFLPGEQAILAQYFGALMGSHDADAFAAYSIGVENQVVTSTLSDKSKAILLVVMATARYGIAYWM